MIVECFAVFECVYCPYRNNVYGPALAHSGRMNPVAAIVSNDGEEHARTIDGYDSFAVITQGHEQDVGNDRLFPAISEFNGHGMSSSFRVNDYSRSNCVVVD